MCGVIGLVENNDVVRRIYRALLTLQHRGQDAAGILTYNGRFHYRKGAGLVKDIFAKPEDIENLKGNIGIGQVRYPTIGSGGAEDAQPFIVNYPFGIAIVHNGNVTNYNSLRDRIENNFRRMLYSTNDVEAILNIFAEAVSRNIKRGKLSFEGIVKSVETVFDEVKGAYSVISYIRGYGMVAFRDPYGIRPLVIGEKHDEIRAKYAISSESVALISLGYKNFRDVKPAEVVYIDEKDRKLYSAIVDKYKGLPHTPCLFEWVYFARPDSHIDKVNVYRTRVYLGQFLGEKIKNSGIEVDVVVPVPDSSRDAAIEVARILKVPYREGLVKNRYIGRTFIMPGEDVRRASVRQKLNPIKDELDGKRVLIVDDSIVRGNTSRNIVEMVREAGAKKVYFASYSPKIISPCFYGIDMQTRGEFVAKGKNEEEIAKILNADAVFYQSLEDLKRAVRMCNPELENFCDACFTGKYPTPEITEELIIEIEEARKSISKKSGYGGLF